jgi:rhamnosyltransferase
MCRNVNAVVVTFNPDIKKLRNLVDSIFNQVNMVFIINNSESINFSFCKYGNVEVHNLGENYGIAYAANIGLQKSCELGAEYVLISDQDTLFPIDYVKSLVNSFNNNTAAVSPAFYDSVSNLKSLFYVSSTCFFNKSYINTGCFDIYQAIASGLLIKHDSLNSIGFFDTDLFMDWVDFEWCWRARAKGFKIIGNADVVIQHQLGDSSKDLGFTKVNLRSPIRHYYITRNGFYLALYSKNLDLGHRVIMFFKIFRYIVGYSILSKPHSKHLKAVLIGFWHGVTKKLGKYELK